MLGKNRVNVKLAKASFLAELSTAQWEVVWNQRLEVPSSKNCEDYDAGYFEDQSTKILWWIWC